jgi:MarR family multiple antibiotic resistance transcriptional regulator
METNNFDLRPYGVNPAKGRDYESIMYVFALIYNRLQTRVDAYFAACGLSAVQFNLLMLAAYQNKGQGISQVQAATHLIASASNITKLVEKSVQEKLLTRQTNPNSRRENIICITKKGQALIDKVWPGYDRLMRSLTGKIPAKNRPQMEQILKNWFIALQEEK